MELDTDDQYFDEFDNNVDISEVHMNKIISLKANLTYDSKLCPHPYF